MIILGGASLGLSILGKAAINSYRYVKTGNLKGKTPSLGQMYKGGFQPKMTPREASLILGVQITSEQAKIVQAHRKLMFLNHPDNGGSTYLSIKINEAKDVLIR